MLEDGEGGEGRGVVGHNGWPAVLPLQHKGDGGDDYDIADDHHNHHDHYHDHHDTQVECEGGTLATFEVAIGRGAQDSTLAVVFQRVVFQTFKVFVYFFQF